MARGRSRAAVQAAAEAAADVLDRHDPALRRADHRAAPDGRAQAGDGHHHAASTWCKPAGRAPRLRRRGRHHLRRQRRRHLRRLDRRALRVGQREARGGRGSGPTSTTSTWPRATPTPTACTTRRCCRRSATPWPSTPIRGCWSWPWPDAGRCVHLDVPPGVPKLPVLDLEPQQLALAFARPSAVPLRPVGHRRAWSTSRPPARPSSWPTIARTSTPPRWPWSWPAAVGRCASWARRRCSTRPIVGQIAKAMGGIRVERATGSDEPLRHAAEALEAGQMVAIMPEGTIPAGPGVLRAGAEGSLGRGPPRRHDPGPGDSRSGCGGPRRCGPGPSALPQHPERDQPADRAHPRRPSGDAQVPQRRRRHQADHEGHRRRSCRPRRASITSRPARSWPAPSRPATRAIRTTRRSAAPAPTRRALK